MEDPLVPRDISWLSFNHRVLQEARDPSVPLFEKIKFLAIYSSNLDEFYRVRVASLRSFRSLKKKTRRSLDVRPKKTLRAIRQIVQDQQNEFGAIYKGEILPALNSRGLFLVDQHQFSPEQKEFATRYFSEKISGRIQHGLVDQGEEAPFLKNKGLYFLVSFRGAPGRYGWVEIPADAERFVVLPSSAGEYHVSFIDDIIRSCLSLLFQDDTIAGAWSVKLSRDAELYIDDEYDGNLREKILQSLEKRNIGLPTRFLFDATMPDEVLADMKQLFGLTKNDIIPGARYHNFNDFMEFPNPAGWQDVFDDPLPPLPHPELELGNPLIPMIEQADRLLHFPYQDFSYVPALLEEAAADPEVRSIKTTLYRVARDSKVAKALLSAVEQGKEVVVFIEAKARFDEASNLYWGEKLERAGARVRYSYPGIKVHTKLLLISRGKDHPRPYLAYLATGNFNEKTARIYADHALLTADQRLTAEVASVFQTLEGRLIMPRCKHLLVAPFRLREAFEGRVKQATRLAREGKPASITAKMNSLEDPAIISSLYAAGQAGVRIRLIIRGICCLVPGEIGLSDNIEVISLVDRFLEHARIYHFSLDGEEELFLASADWMTRNMDRRVEVAFPILDPALMEELKGILELQWSDNTKARVINTRQDNPYRRPRRGQPGVRAQVELYKQLRLMVGSEGVK